MKTVLISNIGNRNIKYKGEEIPVKEKQFKTLTKYYWNDIDNLIENISIEILPNHINENVEKIYLFVTNQKDEKFNHQDTLYEGLIIQKKIKQDYQIDVELLEFEGNPSDENEISEVFSNHLKRIIGTHNNHFFVFNDAGGTTQMKIVIKNLLQYYLSEDKYQIVYSNQSDETRIVNRIYNKKYILLKTAIQFIKSYNYTGAEVILKEIDSEINLNPALIQYVNIAALRINFELLSVKKFLKQSSIAKTIRKNQLLQAYAQQKIANIDYIGFPNDYKEKSRNDIFEIASICQLYFKNKNYTLGVATYYRLCEEICQNFVEDNNKNYDLSKIGDREKFIANCYEIISQHYPNMQAKYGLPFQMAYTYIHCSEELKKVIKELMSTNSIMSGMRNKGIDLLRNKCFLAHKNEPVTLEKIDAVDPSFVEMRLPSIFKLLKLPDTNIYDTINEDIIKLFMQE